MRHFKDKVAFVTGAASGMGRAISKDLVKSGASVIATDVNMDLLSSLQEEVASMQGDIEVQKLDVSDREEFTRQLWAVKSDFGQLDFIFNNAGIAIAGEVRDLAWEDWQKTIDIDQMGVLHGTLAAYEIMLEQGHGHIVNTASIAGLIPAVALAPYVMAKHAVVGLSITLREEAMDLGVNVSVVCPGGVKTAIAEGDFARGADIPNIFEDGPKLLTADMATPKEAARIILKGVRDNKDKIIFPSHGKMLVRMYKNVPSAVSAITQKMLKTYRKDLRKS